MREEVQRKLNSNKEQRAGTSGADREALDERIEELENEDERLEAGNEAIEERMSLKDRVKSIFQRHGFTVVSVSKSGLSKVSKGVGDGLKEIGKKLAGIFPGMVGAIVSFIFKAAGEAIGFLSKHAYLLILLVVTFIVEQFKLKGKKS